jgi:hypothetical protein
MLIFICAIADSPIRFGIILNVGTCLQTGDTILYNFISYLIFFTFPVSVARWLHRILLSFSNIIFYFFSCYVAANSSPHSKH